MFSKNKFKNELFDITSLNFNEKALELFNYQSQFNSVYKAYLDLRKISVKEIEHFTQIPFLPISFFKYHKVVNEGVKEEVVFKSSGTTLQTRSQHYVSDLSFYQLITEKNFNLFYGNLNKYLIIALLPSYLENKNSSLIYMLNHFIPKTAIPSKSGFTGMDVLSFEPMLKEAIKTNKKIIVFGVTYALIELSKILKDDLSDIIIIETGGMKGRGEEMLREEVHVILKEKLNVSQVHSEYGMTELMSQAYSFENGIFQTPPWMKVLIREINDPFSINPKNIRSGGINVIDLGNIDSCAFIETEDIGELHGDKFKVLGRLDNSEVRGCNMLFS